MKIMTFNTQHCQNFITGEIDFNIMADAIKKCDADIVALNEIYGQGTASQFNDQPKHLADLCGFDEYCFAQAIDIGGGNPYGNAILSKFPIKSQEVIMIPDPDIPSDGKGFETRCILKVHFENGVTVLVTHFGLNLSEQENAIKTVLENLESEKCILMGDFNVTPENPLLSPIKERLFDAGKFCPDELSFPSDTPDRKIDYIFVSPDVSVKTASIPGIIASDHRPHIAEVDF